MQLHQGDCLDILRTLPAQSVRCCVTSPPYYGLRDYGHDGQIGLEDTPDAYVARLVDVFRAVRRVLTDDGTLWLNLGDSYAASGISQPPLVSRCGFGGRDQGTRGMQGYAAASGAGVKRTISDGYKPKDLLGIPWRVAFALQADGWYLRSDIVWHKPNAMPESVRDRPTRSHEYLFLLTKSARYYYDSEAVAEPATDGEKFHGDYAKPGVIQSLTKARNGRTDTDNRTATRNRRTVWTIPTRPYSGAHFATFPPALVEPCILAGSAPGDTVIDPFAGSGTVLAVAKAHGRDGIGIDLNADYLALAERRIAAVA